MLQPLPKAKGGDVNDNAIERYNEDPTDIWE
jgi:hypothetical protein